MPAGHSGSPITEQEDKHYDLAVRERLKDTLKNVSERIALVEQQLALHLESE